MITELLELFAKKEGYHFFHRLKYPNLTQIKKALTEMQNKQIALYIHIPFCQRLCPYCSFVRYKYEETPALVYMKNLRKELEIYLDLIQNTSTRIRSVYFGGGTPTLLIYPLIDMIRYLQDRLGIEEFSVETHPEDLTSEKMKALSENGIKRLSIGVQSFSDDILRKLGRLNADSNFAQKAVSMAQGNFDTVNVDLLWDLPQQTISHIEKDIQTLFRLDVDQATFYPILPSPNKKTLLERRFHKINRGLFRKNHNHKRIYEFIQKTMKEHYMPSTVWCFSKNGTKIIDEYVVDCTEYIGMGCGSVSMVNGYYNVNTFPVDKYNQFLSQGNLPVVRSNKLSDWELSNYQLLTKFFGVKVPKKNILQNISKKREKWLKIKLALLKKFGYLIENKNFFQLTPKGMYQVDLLMRQSFVGMNALRERCLEGGI